MDFPIVELMDQESCYRKLTGILHPAGLCCPRCRQTQGLNVHRRNRWPVVDYHCKGCGRVFNVFTGTVFQGTSRTCAELLIILRGIAQGVTTAQLARELRCSRPRLLELRHVIQDRAMKWLDITALPDAVAEVDEMYQNAGEKRHPTRRPGRSAATKSQQGQGPRHMGKRPPAGVRNCRASKRPGSHGSGASK